MRKESGTMCMNKTLVAGNGWPTGILGWMAPIVKDGELCYLAESFGNKGTIQLNTAEEEKLVTRVDPVPMNKAFPLYSPAERDRSAKGPLSLRWYVFYANREQLSYVGKLLEENIELECCVHGRELNFKDNKDLFIARAVSRDELINILKNLYYPIQVKVKSKMAFWYQKDAKKASVFIDQGTQLLVRTAWNRNRAIEAIMLRGLFLFCSIDGPNREKRFHAWLSSITTTWDLSNDFWGYWKEKMAEFALTSYVQGFCDFLTQETEE